MRRFWGGLNLEVVPIDELCDFSSVFLLSKARPTTHTGRSLLGGRNAA